jgi:oligopeptidase B
VPQLPTGKGWENTPKSRRSLLDGNKLAEGHAFFAIGDTDITDDGRWLAYTTDTTGFRQYTLHIKDLPPAKRLPGEVERVGSVVWAADNLTLFYTVEDEEQKRQFQLWRAMPRHAHSEAVLVYQDDDERFNLGAGRTRDGKYLVMESASHTTSESGSCRADESHRRLHLISPREDEHEYSVDHRNGLWFIRTNDAGRNFRLVTAPVAAPGREHWTERIPHRDNVMLEDVDLFANFFVACEREDGLPRLRIWRFQRRRPEAALSANEIAFPEPAYSAHPHINRIFDTPLSATPTNRWSRPVRSTNTTQRPALHAAQAA